jgi:hypothetical protein
MTCLWSRVVTGGASFFPRSVEDEEKKRKQRVPVTPQMLHRFCRLRPLPHDESLSCAARRPAILQLLRSCKMSAFVSWSGRHVSALVNGRHVGSGRVAGTGARVEVLDSALGSGRGLILDGNCFRLGFGVRLSNLCPSV